MIVKIKKKGSDMEIIGFPNYLIYEDGRVYSKYKRGFLIPILHNIGYHRVCVCVNGKKTFLYIHRLVAEHYIPNPENRPQVDHINRIKDDNRIENLRWATAKENSDNRGMNNRNTSGHMYITYNNPRWKFKCQKKGHQKYKILYTKTDALCYKYIFLLKLKSNLI